MKDPSGPRADIALAATAAFSVVTAVSCAEFLLWSLAGRSNEWPPIAGATLALALGAGVLAAILTPFVGRLFGVCLAVVVPLVPFARHVIIAVGLDQLKQAHQQ